MTRAIDDQSIRPSTRGRRANGAAVDLKTPSQLLPDGVDRSPAPSATFDRRGRLVDANAAYAALTGRTPEQLRGMSWMALTHDDDLEVARTAFQRLVDGEEVSFVHDQRQVHPDGTTVWARVHATLLSQDRPLVLVIAIDLSQERRLADALAHRAAHDEMTGLPARALFLELLTVALRRLQRPPGGLVAIGFLDVDGLKAVNDTYGHAVGDELIAAVVDRIREVIRPDDVVARVGGDEFTVLLADLAAVEGGQAAGRRMLEAIAAPFALSVGPVRVSASLGIVSTADHQAVPEQLVSQADAAMYTAKRKGGDRVEVFDANAYTHHAAAQRLQQRLRAALDEGEFRLAYQPIVDLKTGAMSAVEALLRWEHPERGLLTAAEFIETVERSGLILPVGRWVLNEACAQLARWDDELGSAAPPQVYLNVSVRQLEVSDFVGDLAKALRLHGVGASRLCLEITETEFLHDADTARAVLKAADDLGFAIAIDDFGTGYSSLTRLIEVQASAIKIDASFVQQVRFSREAVAVISATLLLAEHLRQDVIAEGIEQPEDLVVLRDMGCGFAQGFHLGEPMPAHELVEWIANPTPRVLD